MVFGWRLATPLRIEAVSEPWVAEAKRRWEGVDGAADADSVQVDVWRSEY